MRRDVFWIPALLVGSALYWTVAMRLGSLSLGVLGTSSEELELVPAVTTVDVDIVEEPLNVDLEVEEGHETGAYEAEEMAGEPIIVRLQPWVDGPEELTRGAGDLSHSVGCLVGGGGTGGVAGAAGSDDPRGGAVPPPEDSIGRTAF